MSSYWFIIHNIYITTNTLVTVRKQQVNEIGKKKQQMPTVSPCESVCQCLNGKL